MRLSLLFCVTGHVQGVGFRAFVRNLAYDYQITGEVWNCSDGSVRILAEHESRDNLMAFKRDLMLGPGKPQEVREEPSPPSERQGFVIGRTRCKDGL